MAHLCQHSARLGEIEHRGEHLVRFTVYGEERLSPKEHINEKMTRLGRGKGVIR